MRLGMLASAYSPFPHPGHLWAMQQAIDAGACDGILAAVQVDPADHRHEKRHPALSLDERVAILESVRYIKQTVWYDTEAGLADIMRYLRPAVRIIGEDHRHDHNTGDDIDPPIPVFWARRNPEWSGTKIARRIAESLPDVAASLRFTAGMDQDLMARYNAQEIRAIQICFRTIADAFDRWQADREARGNVAQGNQP